jgi:hypothetical protein
MKVDLDHAKKYRRQVETINLKFVHEVCNILLMEVKEYNSEIELIKWHSKKLREDVEED